MSPDIIKEIEFLICSVLLGVVITFVYDWLRILRSLIKHNNFFVSLQDFLFWIFCSIAAFSMLYQENNGVIRWFAVIGATIGMFLYKLLISRYFVKIMIIILGAVGTVLGKIGRIISIPIKWFCKKFVKLNKKTQRSGSRFFRFLKKKLTSGIKMVKIMLCKH